MKFERQIRVVDNYPAFNSIKLSISSRVVNAAAAYDIRYNFSQECIGCPQKSTKEHILYIR